MHLPLLLIALACAGPAGPTTALPHGAHDGSTERPTTWSVALEAGEVLQVGALSKAVDLELTLTPARGAPVVARSSRAEHRAADLRYVAPDAETVRIEVRSQTEEERGHYTLLRRRPMTGTVCDQLGELAGADRWELKGAEHSADEGRRTRTLVDVMPWAQACTVNQLQELDVGASCVAAGLTREEAAAAHPDLEGRFRACHGDWELRDESSGDSRELTAEKAGNLRFLRLRDRGEAGWELSVGAMPEDAG